MMTYWQSTKILFWTQMVGFVIFEVSVIGTDLSGGVTTPIQGLLTLLWAGMLVYLLVSGAVIYTVGLLLQRLFLKYRLYAVGYSILAALIISAIPLLDTLYYLVNKQLEAGYQPDGWYKDIAQTWALYLAVTLAHCLVVRYLSLRKLHNINANSAA